MTKPLNMNNQTIIKRIYWLAWRASCVVGMGIFQDKPSATEEDVWKNVQSRADYPIQAEKKLSPNRWEADYVFGRMMKLYVRIEDGNICIRPKEFRSDYQSFCHKYPTPDSLMQEAINSLK